MRLTEDQFEIAVKAALDATVAPLIESRNSGTQRVGVMETTASIIAALTRVHCGIELTIAETLAVLAIDDKVWDYMQLVEQPGDENTPEPTPPDLTENARSFAARFAGQAAEAQRGPMLAGLPDDIDLAGMFATRVADCYYIAQYATELRAAMLGKCLRPGHGDFADRILELAGRVRDYVFEQRETWPTEASPPAA